MSNLKVIACDDEPLALERLSNMLGCCEGATVVGATTNGAELVAMVLELEPDAIFLDIEMPELDGFDIVEEVSRRVGTTAKIPVVVFVTAYPQFAVQAFDTGAIDFLAKPVRLPRLQATLARITRAVEGLNAAARLKAVQDGLPELRLAQFGVEANHDYIWIQRLGEFVRIDIKKIDWVAAEGEYVRLHVGETSYLHRELIGALATRLDPSRFIRIHRSAMVQVDRVVKIARSRHGGAFVRLNSGRDLPIGRKYAKMTRRTLMPGQASAAGQSRS